MTVKKWENQNSQDMQPGQMPTVGRTRTRSRRQTGAPAQAAQGEQAQGQQVQGPPAAFEEFLEALQPALQQAGPDVQVQDRAGWVKIENVRTGHKLYVNKGITAVTRIECTLAPEQVKGAEAPDFYNGRIMSLIPPTVEAVSEAIMVIANLPERLAGPRRRTRDIAG